MIWLPSLNYNSEYIDKQHKGGKNACMDSNHMVYLENLYLMNSLQWVNPETLLSLVCVRVSYFGMVILMLPFLIPVVVDKNDKSWGKMIW